MSNPPDDDPKQQATSDKSSEPEKIQSKPPPSTPPPASTNLHHDVRKAQMSRYLSSLSGYSGFNNNLSGLTGPSGPIATLNFDDLLSPASRQSALTRLVPSDQLEKLEKEIADKRRDLHKTTLELKEEKQTRKEIEAKLHQLKEKSAKLEEVEQLAFILNRVTPRAHNALSQHENLRDNFSEKPSQSAYVVAIDIRRSTDLMLKAVSPDLFAGFMTDLCNRLQSVIKDHFGVFDKFTGDGILAFFPDFFTGSDSAYYAVTAAHEAREIFRSCYKDHRASFTTILMDVDLTAGIDHGPVHLVRVADGLTVVGRPVVYACRLSNGPAGHVFLNQGAFQKLSGVGMGSRLNI